MFVRRSGEGLVRVFPHERELEVLAVAAARQALANPVVERGSHRGFGGVAGRAIPADEEERNPVVDGPLDFPVGNFRIALVIPAQQRFAFRKARDCAPTGAVVPKWTHDGAEQVAPGVDGPGGRDRRADRRRGRGESGEQEKSCAGSAKEHQRLEGLRTGAAGKPAGLCSAAHACRRAFSRATSPGCCAARSRVSPSGLPRSNNCQRSGG